MNHQEVFDKVATHLLTQNARSRGSGNSCQYLSHDGKMCAVGCLFPKEILAKLSLGPMTNNASVACLPDYGLNALGLAPLLDDAEGKLPPDYEFLADLQNIHDNLDCPIEKWPDELAAFATTHGLSFPTLLTERLSNNV